MLKKTDKITLGLFLGAILCLSIFLFWKGYSQRVLSFSSLPQQSLLENQSYTQLDSIQIPKLKLDLVIEEAKIIDGIWQISQYGASHLSSSAHPGSKGNIIIYGHNKKELFGKLGKLRLDDEIIITTKDLKKHQYKIYNILTVSPNQVEILAPTSDEILILYTCTGFADSQRLVLKAKPIS